MAGEEKKKTRGGAVPAVVEEDLMSKIWEMKARGVSVRAISKSQGITQSKVRSLLTKIGERFRETVLHMDPLTLVAENLHWIDELERVALFEVAASGRKKQPVVDPNGQPVMELNNETGKMEPVVIDVVDPNKAKFFSSALKCREMKLRLMIDVGIIPKDPAKLFKGLEAFAEHERDVEEEVAEERTPEEIKQSIEDLLKHGRRM
jgi:hypothetical protein